MRRLASILALLVFGIVLAAAPAMASDPSPAFFVDWGSAFYDPGESMYSINTLIRLQPGAATGFTYLDLGFDYGDLTYGGPDPYLETMRLNLGLTLRSPRAALLFFHPYVGAGISYDLASEAGFMNTDTYVLYGFDFFCFFGEHEVLATDYGLQALTRLGFRIGF